jgi:AcrR family transcriptional regulator
MPRPSLKSERTAEILDAFEACVARFGLDGSTLQKISEEAGIGRPMLRHYLGNREEMVKKLLDHVLGKFACMTDEISPVLPKRNRVTALLDLLFDFKGHSPQNAAVFQALIAASDRFPETKGKLLNFVFQFENMIVAEIATEWPKADAQACQIAATGIAAIYFNSDALFPLDPPAHWRANQRLAAQFLVNQF